MSQWTGPRRCRRRTGYHSRRFPASRRRRGCWNRRPRACGACSQPARASPPDRCAPVARSSRRECRGARRAPPRGGIPHERVRTAAGHYFGSPTKRAGHRSWQALTSRPLSRAVCERDDESSTTRWRTRRGVGQREGQRSLIEPCGLEVASLDASGGGEGAPAPRHHRRAERHTQSRRRSPASRGPRSRCSGNRPRGRHHRCPSTRHRHSSRWPPRRCWVRQHLTWERQRPTYVHPHPRQVHQRLRRARPHPAAQRPGAARIERCREACIVERHALHDDTVRADQRGAILEP